jgi:hypothetical protein
MKLMRKAARTCRPNCLFSMLRMNGYEWLCRKLLKMQWSSNSNWAS